MNPILNKSVSFLFVFCLFLSNYSIGQNTVKGTYTKLETDMKGIPVIGSPFRYNGITHHKLILKKNKTFLYRTHHKASEFRSHYKKGKVYNLKTVSKSKHQGKWEIKKDSLILIEKQLDSLVLFIYEVENISYLCTSKNSNLSDFLNFFSIPSCFIKRNRTK